MTRWARRRTVESFDYQWGRLPEGKALLSDPGFAADVSRILWQEELAVERSWFEGRSVLDVGCGNGRWTAGFVELGCRVTAVDAAASACRAVKERFGERVEVMQLDILDPGALGGRCFDLVFAWGVLHHTGDTRRAFGNCAAAVARDGLLHVYLYGSGSLRRRDRVRLRAGRTLLRPFSPDSKRALLERFYAPERLHNAFDVWAPPINDRVEHDDVRDWFSKEGFDSRVTIDHTEVFMEGWQHGSAVTAALLDPVMPPYWFQSMGPS